jgi:hypothetical protein
VIGVRPETARREVVAHRLDRSPGGRIHDGTSRSGTDQAVGPTGALVVRPSRKYRPRQVGTVERADFDTRIAEVEVLEDIGANCGGRARGQRERRTPGRRHEPSDPAVRRPKIVAPLTDAVSLVDRNEPDLEALEHRPKRRHIQSLGGHEEDVDRTCT